MAVVVVMKDGKKEVVWPTECTCHYDREVKVGFSRSGCGLGCSRLQQSRKALSSKVRLRILQHGLRDFLLFCNGEEPPGCLLLTKVRHYTSLAQGIRIHHKSFQPRHRTSKLPQTPAILNAVASCDRNRFRCVSRLGKTLKQQYSGWQ